MAIKDGKERSFLRKSTAKGGKHWPPILFGAAMFEGARYIWEKYTNKETSTRNVEVKQDSKTEKN